MIQPHPGEPKKEQQVPTQKAKGGAMNEFSKTLREERKKHQLTLRALGEKVGKSITYLSDIESGRRMPPGDEIVRKIENAFGFNDNRLQKAAERVRSLPKKIRERAKASPRYAAALLRADRELSDEEWNKAVDFIEKLKNKEAPN
ncbi:MAG: helix-turn-helix transcriptional regulator [Desulfofustis sp. PB-SRB1]|nr:helix-turn-helix transcriptional regulator [Desulfofustis sp. PB-SRB1]